MKLKPLFIGGTGSDAGKTTLVTALMSWSQKIGIKACPFKAQNMSLNSYVTANGEEMAISQAIQAKAAGIVPDVRMNPILIKPNGNFALELVVLGKSLGQLTYQEYSRRKKEFEAISHKAFLQLQNEYAWMVLEGAGSVAEINLWDRDIVNFSMAEFAGAECWLVADMERGGAFASIHGTLDLLPEKWRRLVSGYVLNKFKGDSSLLQKGIYNLENLDGKPCHGVFPFLDDVKLPSEDSLSFSIKPRPGRDGIIGILMYPHASMLIDFEPLWEYQEFGFELIKKPSQLNGCHGLILPGSKNSLLDLKWLLDSNFDEAISGFEGPVWGICGGLQMMGQSIADPENLEGSGLGKLKGLSLLPIETIFDTSKIVIKKEAVDPVYHQSVLGYEIHKGKSYPNRDFYAHQNFRGCYMHGIFKNDGFRNSFLEEIHYYKTGIPKVYNQNYSLKKAFDGLAENISIHLQAALPHGLKTAPQNKENKCQ